MSFADQLTVARAAAVPIVVVLFAVSFPGHDYWATGVFCAAMATDWFDGRIARRTGRTSSLGSLLDPVADKLLVMATLIVLLDQHVFSAWMVAAIVAREFLISGLRQAAIERGVVIAAPGSRQAEDVVAGDGGRDRRARRRRRLEATGSLVGAPRRTRPDVDLRARLREVGAERVARPRGSLAVERLVEAGLPPEARRRPTSRRVAPRPPRRPRAAARESARRPRQGS